ncbi:MAG: tRNA (N6-threonylcarbamoyladenosine(37)-N6)-methyltransferase TrmO [Candidatus Thorarchaeota archaeon]
MKPCVSFIGYVKKPKDARIYIEINQQYRDAVQQLNQFSHIIVLWWITGHDNPTSRANLHDFPPQNGAELSGVFASRSPARPTPIGLSIVALEEIDPKTERLYIDQIDAFDDSPIIDIKPYMPFSDKVDHARVPQWFQNNVPRYTTQPL